MRADRGDLKRVVGTRPEIRCQHGSTLPLPDHPRTIALRFHAIEADLVLERIHDGIAGLFESNGRPANCANRAASRSLRRRKDPYSKRTTDGPHTVLNVA